MNTHDMAAIIRDKPDSISRIVKNSKFPETTGVVKTASGGLRKLSQLELQCLEEVVTAKVCYGVGE